MLSDYATWLCLALLAAVSNLPAQEIAEVAGVEVRASGVDESALGQTAPVGPYHQPQWTTERAFSTTRVYVRPPGSLEVVQYWTPEWKDGVTEHAFREELEIGLPHRFQLDLYQNWGIDAEGRSFYKGSSVELRYALADWGKIPLNPTLYAEWAFNDAAPDVWELKLLLGETFARRWNWAANLVYEQETGGARETEIAFSTALNYAIIDEKLNVGFEALAERRTKRGSRSKPEHELLVGPSINVHPTRNSFVTVAPLFGTTKDSPDVELFVVAGFQFSFGGPRREKEGPQAPASMFGR
ncbi:MAG: hypothetical protein QOD12_2474 [Verrucomicrobiota bacterium]